MTVHVGQLIDKDDFPAASHGEETTTLTNITDTSPAVGSPVCSTTCKAPTSGKILMIYGGGARTDTSTDGAVRIKGELREDNASGTVVSGGSQSGVRWSCGATSSGFQYGTASDIIEGLTPGRIYYGQTTHWTNAAGSGNADIYRRDIILVPLPG